MVERASTTVSSTTSSAWAPGHAWSQYCSPSAGSTLAALMPSALHRGPLRISPVKSEPYDMAADIPPSIKSHIFMHVKCINIDIIYFRKCRWYSHIDIHYVLHQLHQMCLLKIQ
ncbi:Uncharacterized protein FWK35_00023064 [Aphis craccivora]|uniref:Uncharacterized protein n=1 Tax=Aphis craccivora TaxID=307492 RepID=A0A6G0ZC35_APHCR|nr:Uncharacterized protein FWK35_00023064 [Aphis craccivora]